MIHLCELLADVLASVIHTVDYDQISVGLLVEQCLCKAGGDQRIDYSAQPALSPASLTPNSVQTNRILVRMAET